MQRIVWLVFIITLFAASVQAQWTKTAGPTGGVVTTLLQNGTVTFAGVNGGGVYRTASVFEKWTQASTGLKGNSLYPTTILASGTTLWLGTQEGLYRSADSGGTWTASGASTFSGVKITKVVTDGSGGIIAATDVRNVSKVDTVETPSECVYRSTDNGATWAALSSKLPKHVGESFSLATVKTTFDTRIYALSNRSGVYVSTDAGKTWNSFSQGLTGNAFRLETLDMLVDGGTLYVCNRDGVYSRTIALTPTQPESAAWQAANAGLKGQTINAITKTGDAIFVGTEASGAYLSTDGGTTWVAVNTGLTNLAVKCFANVGTTVILGSEGAGVLTSPRSGVTWEQANTGIVAGVASSLTVIGNTLFAATSGNGIQFSRDAGATWSAAKGINTPPQGPQGLSAYVTKIASAGSRLLAATKGGLFASNDAGATWAGANGTGTGALKNYALEIYDIAQNPTNNKLDVATADGLYVSADDGKTWVRRTSGLDDSVSIRVLAFKGATMFGGTIESGIFRSTDGGDTWRESSHGFSDYALPVNDLLVSGANVFAATDDGVYVSSDDGKTWKSSSTGLDKDNTAMYRIVAQNGILVATGAAGVYRSTNGGAAWQSVSQGLTNTSNRALAADNANFYITDDTFGGGVWKRPISQVTSVAAPAVLQTEDVSVSIAPNPTNAGFEVRFTTAQTARVAFSVTDMLGRTVLGLAAADYQAGEHALRFDAENLASGMYVVQIHGGAFSASRLLHIVR